MEKRSYNIFFDLHTVSGIILSVLLFVIFFAGSFSFFRDEIVNWERNETVASKGSLDIDVDAVLEQLPGNIPFMAAKYPYTKDMMSEE